MQLHVECAGGAGIGQADPPRQRGAIDRRAGRNVPRNVKLHQSSHDGSRVMFDPQIQIGVGATTIRRVRRRTVGDQRIVVDGCKRHDRQQAAILQRLGNEPSMVRSISAFSRPVAEQTTGQPCEAGFAHQAPMAVFLTYNRHAYPSSGCVFSGLRYFSGSLLRNNGKGPFGRARILRDSTATFLKHRFLVRSPRRFA